MRILGIDYGDQRIGLALSDFTGTLVGRAWTLHEWNLDRAIEAIAAVVKENEVGRLVLGLPKNMDGSEGPRAEKSRAVAARLTEATGLAWRRTQSCTQTAEKKKSTARVWTRSRQVSSLRAISVRWEVRLYDEAARRRSGRHLS